MHAEHLGNGFALRVRLVSPSRESMVRNVTKEESAPRHPIPRLAGGGTTKPTEPQPPAGAVAIASRERRRLPAQPPPALCFPDTWLWPVVGQPRDGGGGRLTRREKNSGVACLSTLATCAPRPAPRVSEMPVSCHAFRAPGGGWNGKTRGLPHLHAKNMPGGYAVAIRKLLWSAAG